MGLAAMVLAQALVSLAPTLENVRSFDPAGVTTPVPCEAVACPAPDRLVAVFAAEGWVPDTVRRRRAVSLSDGYYTRLDIHRIASYGTIPLFLLETYAGQKLLEEGSGAPLWAEKVHKPAAYLVAGLFTVNTVTGLWNLIEAKDVQEGKTRRWVHGILMLVADAGFIYGASVAPSTETVDQRIADGTRGGWTPHKATTVASMSLATVAYAMMYLWKD